MEYKLSEKEEKEFDEKFPFQRDIGNNSRNKVKSHLAQLYMKDTKIKSLVESIFNIVVGFLVAYGGNIFILPFFGMPFSWANFGYIGALFTLLSLIRSFVIRRVFVHGFYEDVFVKIWK